MKRLLQFFIELCLLRATPQDLPGAWLLVGLLLPINLLVGMLLIGDGLGGLDRAFVAAVVDLLVMSAWTRMLLVFKKHSGRFLQTLTALLGIGTVLGLIALPMQLALGDVSVGADAGVLTQLLSLLLLFVMVWSIVVAGHVYRHALEVTLGLGMGLALSYSVITTLIIGVIFPEGSG